MIQELKAQAYDILVQIDLHQQEINRLKEQLIEINTQIQTLSNEESVPDSFNPVSSGL
jgi:prefoldin subunit 5